MSKASEFAARQAKEQQQEKTKQATAKIAAQKEAQAQEDAKELAVLAEVHQAEAQPKETKDTPLVQRFRVGDVEYEVNHVAKEVFLFENVLGEAKKRPTNGNYDVFMQQIADREAALNLPVVDVPGDPIEVKDAKAQQEAETPSADESPEKAE